MAGVPIVHTISDSTGGDDRVDREQEDEDDSNDDRGYDHDNSVRITDILDTTIYAEGRFFPQQWSEWSEIESSDERYSSKERQAVVKLHSVVALPDNSISGEGEGWESLVVRCGFLTLPLSGEGEYEDHTTYVADCRFYGYQFPPPDLDGDWPAHCVFGLLRTRMKPNVWQDGMPIGSSQPVSKPSISLKVIERAMTPITQS